MPPDTAVLWEAKLVIYFMIGLNGVLSLLVIFFINELYQGFKELSRGMIRVEQDLIAIKMRLKMVFSNGGNDVERGHGSLGTEGIQ